MRGGGIKFLKIVHLYIVVVFSLIKDNNLFSFLFQHSIDKYIGNTLQC